MLKTKLVFLILFAFFGLFRAQAQTTALQPVETHIDMGFMGLFGTMEYTLDGKKIERYEDFKKLIYPLNDPEASKLIREAEQTDFIASMAIVTGVVGAADIALVYSPISVFHVDWMDRIVTGVVTAQIGLGIWAIAHNAAEHRKFNAVERYNQVIQNQTETSSIELNPCLYACFGGLVLGEKLAFQAYRLMNGPGQ